MQLFLGSLTDWITHISANSIIMMIMMIFMVIGGVDYIRGNKLGYGKEFEEGFKTMGTLAMAVAAIIAIAPCLSQWIRPLVTPIACFIASCLVGFLSDICSRICKEAATIFIIPGMICLVPGYNIYYTMEALLGSELGDAAKVGSQTLLMAGAIAAGLLVIGAVINVIRSIIKKTAALAKEKL